uniref:NADPH2:quinone reductase n=1 Tax=Candidatus Kentrum sp. MB TaxID=2138164 RepID=A0A450XD56_9GAMM|nr:MAG: NADPH2:quinone reductase [Candidatus Kentron sp. MB]VFK75093.1 MAG: NADPH2:quinone reductase [Candidatus Kentron sp. MB]
MQFNAYRLYKKNEQITSRFEKMSLDQLTAGEVVIRVDYSSVNYKDALILNGGAQILRASALNGGIDLAGTVMESFSPRFSEGDKVMVCGGGLSEIFDGGFAEYARVPENIVLKIPDSFTEFEAMAIGTAGFTAALSLLRMEQNGQRPDQGPILVTGATGGVGSIAIDILSNQGYRVVALTGKTEQHDYLRAIGAHEIIDRNSLSMGDQLLEEELWAGAIDNVGGDLLGWLTRTVKNYGNIVSVGMAGGELAFPTTAMPFILRGISLLGGSSIQPPSKLRDRIWARLATDLKPKHLQRIATRTIGFEELPTVFDDYIKGRIVGRTVVKFSS